MEERTYKLKNECWGIPEEGKPFGVAVYKSGDKYDCDCFAKFKDGIHLVNPTLTKDCKHIRYLKGFLKNKEIKK